MSIKPIYKEEIKNIILSLNPRKAGGPDNMKIELIQRCLDELIEPLMIIYELSFKIGEVPNKMKIAKVVPIHKKGKMDQVNNYRPISLLSVFGKILEKLFCKRLIKFLDKNGIINKYQFGFRAKHSTSLALIDVMDDLYNELDKNKYVLGLYLDLQKAFDTVNHSILLGKIKCYGIRGVAYNWINSYLTDRVQYTTNGDVCSEIGYINCGVPQGSIMGPILFLLYINDIHKAVPF